MKYRVAEDLILIRRMLNLSQSEIAAILNLDRKTIARIENKENDPSNETIEAIYDYAYRKGIRINGIKEMLYKEDYPSAKILFHGSKEGIAGRISPNLGKKSNDFGPGFYCGESYEQASSFVARFQKSSVYVLSFDDSGLAHETFCVNQEWMLTVAYFRGKLEAYKNHAIIKDIISKVKNADYIRAPIADNRMFRIIDRFIDGEITDEQCKHCLAATNLGNQYAFLTEKAINKLQLLENCYISDSERNQCLKVKENDIGDSDNKVKYALIKYKREGKYIEEILA